MEEKVRYEQYQRLLDHVLATCGETQTMPEPRLIHPVELAYIGDAVFSLYVRMRLLPSAAMYRCSTIWPAGWCLQ